MKDILIVEDGQQERERLEALFKKAGYTAIACNSVGDAENALTRDAVRLAILDIGLGDKSGSSLFNLLKRTGKAAYVIIFTGNPSVHLKQRFLEEGAADYIVKASPQAQNDTFMARVKELIGEPHIETVSGLDLEEFLSRFIPEASRQLFFDADNGFPECGGCKSRRYVVSFAHQAQMPPDVEGQVVCAQCGRVMDPEIN